MSAKGQTHRPEQIEEPTGSPIDGEPVFLVVGKLRRPHGLRGEMRMEVWTDFPERLERGVQVYAGDEYRSLTIRSRRWHQDLLLIAFEGYNTPEDVGVFRNQMVYVPADDRPELEEGEFYHHQLLGLRVRTDDGRELGVLEHILETGANDVYILRGEKGGETLLPAIEDVILDIDLEGGEMLVHLLPGLLPE